MHTCASQTTLSLHRRNAFRLHLVHNLVIELRDVAEVLRGSEDIARLIEVATHAHRAIVAVGAMQALRKVLSTYRTDTLCLR